MNKQIKTPKRIKIIVKIIAVVMFLCGLCVLPWMGSSFFSLLNIVEHGMSFVSVSGLSVLPVIGGSLIEISISLSSIIASIGLWKIKKWGLFVSYLALIGVISITTIRAIIWVIRKEVPGIITDDYLGEIGVHCGPPLFVAISILYCLWWNRKYFGKRPTI